MRGFSRIYTLTNHKAFAFIGIWEGLVCVRHAFAPSHSPFVRPFHTASSTITRRIVHHPVPTVRDGATDCRPVPSQGAPTARCAWIRIESGVRPRFPVWTRSLVHHVGALRVAVMAWLVPLFRWRAPPFVVEKLKTHVAQMAFVPVCPFRAWPRQRGISIFPQRQKGVPPKGYPVR